MNHLSADHTHDPGDHSHGPGEHRPGGHGHHHHHDHHHRDRRGGLLGAVRDVIAPHSHDHADSVDDALASSAQGIRAVKISLLALGVTAIFQLVIVGLSGSIALAADTIHNFSDALTAIPLWIAFALGRRPATKRFTYGLGRAEDLAGLFVLTMIALSAAVAGYEAVRRLLHPVTIEHLGWVAAAGVIGFLGNELVALYRIRVGRRIGSAALVADGLHARTDGLTSLAVVVGALGVWLGFPLADPLIGLVITAAILVVLRTAARDVFTRLLDGVDPHLVETAEEALTGAPGVTGIQQLRMRWIGHQLHAEADVDIDPGLTLDQAQQLAHEAQHALTHAVPRVSRAVVHPHPARR